MSEKTETKTKAQRLAELREQIAKTEDDEKSRIEDIEMAMLEVVVKAQAELGVDNVRGVCGRRGFIVVRTPHQATFRKFSEIETPTTEDIISLIKPCVYPAGSWEDVEKLLGKEPGLMLPTSGAIGDLAGVKPRAVSGKSKN